VAFEMMRDGETSRGMERFQFWLRKPVVSFMVWLLRVSVTVRFMRDHERMAPALDPAPSPEPVELIGIIGGGIAVPQSIRAS